MSHYEFYTPVALSAQNYNAFTDLLAAQSSGTLMPRDLAQFVAGHENDVLSPVTDKDGKAYFLERNEKGGFTQIMIWAPKSAPDDISRMVALFVDLHTGKDDALTYEPRQWIIGSNAQIVVSYRMTCCPGMSAIASYKQGGVFHAALLENATYMDNDHQNLFRVGDAQGGFRRDESNEVLSHFHAHLRGIRHHCTGLTLPRGLNVR